MELKVHTSKKYEVIDITQKIVEVVKAANVAEGFCCVFVPHVTAAIVINENDDMQIGLDLIDALDKLVPEGDGATTKSTVTAPLTSKLLSLVQVK